MSRKIKTRLVPLTGETTEIRLSGTPFGLSPFDRESIEIFYEFDTEDTATLRSFRCFHAGEFLPRGARYVASVLAFTGRTTHLYEVFDSEVPTDEPVSEA